MKYSFLVVAFLVSFAAASEDKKVLTFDSPDEVSYSCTGTKCKVCLKSSKSTETPEVGAELVMPIGVSEVCSKSFADGSTMKKAAAFMNSFADRFAKSGIEVPAEGFDFTQFVTSEKAKLCKSARDLIQTRESELAAYREAAKSAECMSLRDSSGKTGAKGVVPTRDPNESTGKN